jgi:hypothetical protein
VEILCGKTLVLEESKGESHSRRGLGEITTGLKLKRIVPPSLHTGPDYWSVGFSKVANGCQAACASLPGRGCPRDSRLGGDPKTTRDGPSMGAPTEGAWPLSKEEGGREGRCAFGHGSREITELATVARHTDQSAGAISAGDVEPDTGRSSQLWGARAMSPPQRLIKSRTRVRLPHSERPANCWCVSASTTAFPLHFVFLLWYVPENSLEVWTSSSVVGRPSSSRLL